MRILGLIFLVGGLWLAHEFIYEPWVAMRAGAPLIEVGTKAVLVTPFAIGFGLLMLLQGDEAAEMLEEGGTRRRQGAVVLLLALALGIGLKIYLYNEARQGGYRGPAEMSDRLTMPVEIDFKADHFDAGDASGRRTSVTWTQLERVQVELASKDGEVFDQLYWQFTLPEGFQVHIPVAAGEARMIEEFGQHLDRVDMFGLKYARDLIHKGEVNAPHQTDVWIRAHSYEIDGTPRPPNVH